MAKKDSGPLLSDPDAEELEFKPQFFHEIEASAPSYAQASLRSSRSGQSLDGTVKGGQHQNIRTGVFPFEQKGDASSIAVTDSIILCQKAYYNVPIFRLTIDIMTEFANSRLFFKGENKEAIKFFQKWWKKVGGWKVGDQFFREWFRSGNVPIYKLKAPLGEFKDTKIQRAQSSMIPLRYLFLNPADLRCDSAASFVDSSYYKVLNKYEASRLKSRTTEADQKLYMSLPPETRKMIDEDKGLNDIKVPLSPDKVSMVFCKKQDYEALSVPMYYPVLSDINLKLEFKKAELVVAKTVDYLILLITMGAPKDKGGTDPKLINAMQDLFKSQSVGRVLVSDWTTEMEFVIPDLNKILGPEKYQVVNQDIADGLMNIFFSENKFADSMIKIKMFLERLNEARKAFIETFLLPEMEEIGKTLGFRSIPEVEFETIDLKDEVEYYKVYNRLAELGFLTPEETFDAYRYNQLPLNEDSIEAQKRFKKLKDSGLYEMHTGKTGDAAGRPTGAKAPQTTKKVQPAGASDDDGPFFSLKDIEDNIKNLDSLFNKGFDYYKESNNRKRLHEKDKNVVRQAIFAMAENEPKDQWEEKYKKYIDSPQPVNTAIASEVADIAARHEVPMNLAAILNNSKRERPDDLEIFEGNPV